uniref:Uncharacterized protein n=1 Tax=Capra hircus TaxID=9925 RepID=A0A452EK50_CAPHI
EKQSGKRSGEGMRLLDDQHPVVRLLRSVSSDCTGGRPVSLDAALAHHLHQCSYHLRLFRNWLRSGRDDPECLYGTPAASTDTCCHMDEPQKHAK